MNLIDVNCYNCGSGQKSYYATENGFTLMKCFDCGLLYVTPRPTDDEIEKAHQFGMHNGESKLHMTGSVNSVKVGAYLKILKDLYQSELIERKGTWLDLGCGHGEFLKALDIFTNGQFTTKGLEPNVHKQAYARKLGFDVSYFDLNDHEQRYDVISFLNVYSHLPNPPEFIKRCRSLLRSKGELLIQTGDSAHLSADEVHRPMYLPDHLSFASEEILCNILKTCGFEIVTVCKYPVILPGMISIMKEFVKIVWPNRISRLRYLVNPKYRAEKYWTRMYIRARARS